MKIVFGLGNPGEKYARTRHNVGFMVINRLAEIHGCEVSQSRFRSQVGEAIILGQPVLLVMPQTYMNLCGPALREILEAFDEPSESSLSIVDDFHLPLGRIRLRATGSSGGHNGLKSIAGAIESTDFPRLKIGIGGFDEDKPIDFVLGEFEEEEEADVVQTIVNVSAHAVETWIESGVAEAMNIFNCKDYTQGYE